MSKTKSQAKAADTKSGATTKGLVPSLLGMTAGLGLGLTSAMADTSVNATAFASEIMHSKGQFDIHHFSLSNGMQVVVLPNNRAPIVHHMLWYKVGAADEDPGRSGIAHLLEHLMFKGTDTNPGDTYSQFVVRHGGKENAFTSPDQTAYHQTIAKEHLPEIMAMEADRMTGLTLEEEEFQSERNVVIEEREQRIGNNPGAQLGEAMMAALYMNHPYRIPVIGWRSEIEDLTREQTLEFYKRWYAPQNAVLVVAGDVTPEQVQDLAVSTYGQIEAVEDIATRNRPVEPTHWGQRRVVIEDEKVGTSQLMFRYIAPTDAHVDPRMFGDQVDTTALSVLAYIMGGDATQRFYRKLVEEQQIAVAAGAFYDPSALDYSGFTAYIVPAPGKSLEEAEVVLRAELALLLDEGVTQEEVETAIRRIKVDLVYEQDSLTTPARIVGRAMSTGLSLDKVQNYAASLEAVTVESVMQAAKAVLVEKQSIAAILKPIQAPQADQS